jgi:hypothetical protein
LWPLLLVRGSPPPLTSLWLPLFSEYFSTPWCSHTIHFLLVLSLPWPCSRLL